MTTSIQILQDLDAFDPRREYDHLGTMVCWHRRYNLGDKHNFSSPEDLNQAVYLPLYLYDHSGITMSTTPFSCQWDSGQVGWIYVTKAEIRKEFGKKWTTKKIQEILRAEVEEYDRYLTGDVYGYIITDDETGEEIDSCWGFYGEEAANEAAIHAQG
jgi:hypothetical protein